MDQFVSTYRKDFLWPYVRAFGMRPDFGSRYRDSFGHGNPCRCPSGPTDVKLVGPNVYSQQTYQKPGPTTPLLEPKIYSAKVGPPPENETQRFNQPNVFLDRLRVKYPFLYEVLRSASPDDIISRIHRDRLRTTYQTDFCNLNVNPSEPYDELVKNAKFQSKWPCPQPERLPGDSYKFKNTPGLNFRHGASFGEMQGKTDKRCAQFTQGGDFENTKNTPGGNSASFGISEYQDAIGKLGENIIRDKIHYRRLNVPNVY